ncbi:MAG: cysteine synthase family protein [Crenarchaeota archaeon]|nr:cysteine synthase family protein [Thermoproteota archaeon]
MSREENPQQDNGNLEIYESVLELAKRHRPTPLVRLRTFGDVWAKLEFYNPLSRSIKDRVALYMIEHVRGRCRRVIDASSGNYGIALAVLGKLYGINVTVLLPRKVERYVKTILKILGAECIETDIEMNNDDMIRLCREVADRYEACFIDQFENTLNPEAHYLSTGRELVKQLKALSKAPDVLIAAVGTSGHICGIGRALREEFPNVKIVGVACRESDHIPGMKPLSARPRWIDAVDEIVELGIRDAVRGVVKLARSEGLLVGLSSGAVISALEKIIDRVGRDATYVVVFPDDVFKYVDTIDRLLSEVYL